MDEKLQQAIEKIGTAEANPMASQLKPLIVKTLEDDKNEQLIDNILSETKSFKSCWDYVVQQARKKAKEDGYPNAAMVDSDVVLGWAIEYYLKKEEPKPAPKPVPTKAYTPPKPKTPKSKEDDQPTLF